ncbi:MAG: glycosyltransferase [Nevskiales bacterium]|nr:glycosyltransferase [Nevskiales bacterium]
MIAPIRSLQVIGSPSMGGAENSFVRLVHALTAAGAPADAVTRSGSDVYRALGDHERRFQVPMRNYFDLGTVMRLRSMLREGAYPIVQTWASRATWLTWAPRGTVHVARLGGYYRLRYFRHADAWIVNTHGLREWMIANGFPSARVVQIDNFVPECTQPPPFTRAEVGVPDDAMLSIAFGRLVAKKGFADLLRAMAALPERFDGRPHHLLLMGDGPQRAALEALVRELGLEARVHFTGWIDVAVAALPLADVMICPSREEPLGNVILEAWSRRLPVVSTRTAGGNELIDDAVNGLLCAVQDPADLARAWRRLLSEPALSAELAARGHERFAARYSPQATVSAYADFYAGLLGRAQPTQDLLTR